MGIFKGYFVWVNLIFDFRGKILISGSFDDIIKVWCFFFLRF